MSNKDQAFNNIEKKNIATPTPVPSGINDIDTTGTIYDNIIDASLNNILDINSLSSLTSRSQNRDEVYNLIDIMAEDPIISTALNVYASDACEPNSSGRIIWAEAEDEKVLGCVQYLLDQMNVDKNAYKWVLSLIKYGDVYLRLVRESEYGDYFNKIKTTLGDNEADGKEKLNENVIVKAFSKKDHYENYLEMCKNPAEIFELQKFGKSIGYIRSHIITKNMNPNDIVNSYINQYKYNFNLGDIDIYPATEYVHACLEDTSHRSTEEVSIIPSHGDSDPLTFEVKRGQSILYNVFKIWRELSLLENSVLLNRITKSSIVRTVSVEVGDMEKEDVRTLLQRIKSMIEQKSSISINKSFEDYTNPGPIENVIYVPTHDGKGAITTDQIGGEVKTDDLVDLDYFKNKLYGSLGIPKQYLGDTSDSTGFNGGSSLSLISSQYAKTIKRIQNTMCQAITDAINLILYDRGLINYIDKFTIKMQAPATQEEKDRRESVTSSISTIRDIMSLLDSIDNQVVKLSILKSLLSDAITDVKVITLIQSEIDRLEAEMKQADEETSQTDDAGPDEFDSSESLPLDFEEPDVSVSDTSVPEEPQEPSPETEEQELPNWEDLGVSYNEE